MCQLHNSVPVAYMGKVRMEMSFMSEVIWEGYANTSSSEALKEQFNKFCN